jgi:hypothetical protein
MELMKKHLMIALLAMLISGGCQQEKPGKNSEKKPTMSSIGSSPAVTATINATSLDAACEEGTKQAQADEAKGIIGYYFWGIATPVFARVLKEKYGFVIHSKGCVMNATEGKTWSCYNAYMDEVIKKKYQQDIITLEKEMHDRQDSVRIKQKTKNS